METLKFSRFFGAKNVLADSSMQTTRFHAAPNKADNGDLGKFGVTYLDGTVFAQ